MGKTSTQIPKDKVDLYDKLIASNPNIERKGVTMAYTSVNGHMFTILSKTGSLGLRLPKDERKDFLEKYHTTLYESQGAIMKEYVTVPEDLLENTEELTIYLDTSYDYVKSLKPKPTKRKVDDMHLKNDRIIQTLVPWAEGRASIRAMLLTSTRTMPDAKLDLFSDYDVILAVNDIYPYYEDRSWLEAFGSVLVLYRDPLQEYHGRESFAYITQYEDGLKIDFTLWPVEILRQVAADPVLPDDLDIGYRVLLDKDGWTADLKPPTYSAYIPNPPDESTYLTVIEEFFHETTYVAKLLWRDELMPAKYSLDTVMKLQHLRQMFEWQVEIDHDWAVKPGVFGKGLKKRLGPEIWAEVESTYAGAGLEENWQALFKSIALFRKIAVNVGQALDYKYPYGLDERMLVYLHKVKSLEPQAKKFP